MTDRHAILASFRYASGRTHFHVVNGHAPKIRIDLAVIGRAQTVREQLARHGVNVKTKHLPYTPPRMTFGTTEDGRWTHVGATEFRPARRRPGNALIDHPARLAMDLYRLLTFAARHWPVRRMLFLPPSSRHPEVACAAAVAACYAFTIIQKRHRPTDGWRFFFADPHATSSLTRYLRNEEGILGQFLSQTALIPADSYRRHPLREIAAKQGELHD